MNRSILALGVLFVASLGCVPPATPFNPNFRPDMPIDRWDQGRARVVQERDGIRVMATFLEGGGGALLFEVEVQNRTGSSLLVSPENIQCRLGPFRGFVDNPRVFSAVDPEKEIEHIARHAHALARQQELDRAANGSFLLIGTTAQLAGTVDHLTNPSPDKSRALSKNMDNMLEIQRDGQVRETFQETRIANLQNQREPWERACLRRSSVDPGLGIRGKVVFRLDATEALQVQLLIPVAGQTFTFTYVPM